MTICTHNINYRWLLRKNSESLHKVLLWISVIDLTPVIRNAVQTCCISKWAILDKVKLALIMEWICEQLTAS